MPVGVGDKRWDDLISRCKLDSRTTYVLRQKSGTTDLR